MKNALQYFWKIWRNWHGQSFFFHLTQHIDTESWKITQKRSAYFKLNWIENRNIWILLSLEKKNERRKQTYNHTEKSNCNCNFIQLNSTSLKPISWNRIFYMNRKRRHSHKRRHRRCRRNYHHIFIVNLMYAIHLEGHHFNEISICAVMCVDICVCECEYSFHIRVMFSLNLITLFFVVDVRSEHYNYYYFQLFLWSRLYGNYCFCSTHSLLQAL